MIVFNNFPNKLPDWVTEELLKIPGIDYDWQGSSEMIENSNNINLNLIESIKGMIKSTQDFNKTIQDALNNISNIWSHITHPTKLIKLVWYISVDNCYVVCIIITFTGMILGLIGYKKGFKIAVISFFTYYSIQLFNILLGGR